MIRGPKYRIVLDHIYDEVFRKHIKYGVSVIDSDKEMDERESEIVQAVWDKLNQYLSDELDND
ncbi:MAG: hypothetical protein ACXVCY_18705 [Pseudobdellovibrionaceae bacterium]